MASNSNRRSSSSGSRPERRASSRTRAQGSPQNRRPSDRRSSTGSDLRTRPSTRNEARRPAPSRSRSRTPDRELTYGALRSDRARQRKAEVRQAYLKRVIPIAGLITLVVALIIAAFAIYNSSLFTVTRIEITSELEHVTNQELTEIAAVPAGTTLLRVDRNAIVERLQSHPWITSASVERSFPETLQLVVAEREPSALVMVDAIGTTWYLGDDGHWIEPVDPERVREISRQVEAAGSSEESTVAAEEAAAEPSVAAEPSIAAEPSVDTTAVVTSRQTAQALADAESIALIADVKEGLEPTPGAVVEDEGLKAALAYVQSFSDGMNSQIAHYNATSKESVSMTLDNGVEVALGSAEQIELKESIILKLLAENESRITYINVRVPSNPAWRGIS